MDAIVLVGGEGTRLRPLTYDIPKQMLPVVDRPMIEHVGAWLVRHGVDRVVLSLGYRPVVFLEAFPGDEIDGVHLAYAVEPELLDTAGAVRFAAETAGVSGTFLVLNGDVLSDFDVTSLVRFHKDHGGAATIQLTPVDDPSAFGVVPTDAEGRVTAFIEKPAAGTAPTNLVNAGCYVLEPSVLGTIAPGRRVSIERETFPALVAAGRLFAVGSGSYWLDTGTPATYLQASLDVLAGRRPDYAAPRAPQVAPGRYVHPTAAVVGSLESTAYLGPSASVGAGSSVVDSVVAEGAVIGSDCLIERSIVMAGAHVGPGAVVEGSIVGPRAAVGAGCSVARASVIGVGAAVPDGARLDGARFPAP